MAGTVVAAGGVGNRAEMAAARGSSAVSARQTCRRRRPFKVEIAGSNPAGVTS
jgi:hypothetical protein